MMMPRITFPFRIHRSRSYTLNECEGNSCKHQQNILRIGGEYHPVFEILGHGSVSNKELLYIRIAKQGLIISHKPSVNLSSLAGSLDRPIIRSNNNNNDGNRFSKTIHSHHLYLQRRNTLRGHCHRTRSDRCRLIKWDQIQSIQILKPKSVIFKLNHQNVTRDNDDKQQSLDNCSQYLFCSHRNENISFSSLLKDYSVNQPQQHEQIRFEFLIKQDLESLIAFGIHYQLLQPDGHHQIPFDDDINNNNNNYNDDSNKENSKVFQRLCRWFNRHWTLFRPLS
ncbi:uncharacterized protein LOC142645392 [Dermatophagoides pteronyssinus]|uniref:uncharacterized protein LOC142645392 n=1 Tax=Dermatophagoides pteronyssinus TaxID=6956 RepID=UPI003F67E4F3